MISWWNDVEVSVIALAKFRHHLGAWSLWRRPACALPQISIASACNEVTLLAERLWFMEVQTDIVLTDDDSMEAYSKCGSEVHGRRPGYRPLHW